MDNHRLLMCIINKYFHRTKQRQQRPRINLGKNGNTCEWINKHMRYLIELTSVHHHLSALNLNLADYLF